MPAAVPHNRLPHSAAPIIIIPINEPLITLRPGAPSSFQHVDRFGGLGAVQIPDVDLAVVRAGVDIAAVGAARRGEVAPDEGFEDAVATESDKRAVVGMGLVVFGVVGGEAVVKVGCVVL